MEQSQEFQRLFDAISSLHAVHTSRLGVSFPASSCRKPFSFMMKRYSSLRHVLQTLFFFRLSILHHCGVETFLADGFLFCIGTY